MPGRQGARRAPRRDDRNRPGRPGGGEPLRLGFQAASRILVGEGTDDGGHDLAPEPPHASCWRPVPRRESDREKAYAVLKQGFTCYNSFHAVSIPDLQDDGEFQRVRRARDQRRVRGVPHGNHRQSPYRSTRSARLAPSRSSAVGSTRPRLWAAATSSSSARTPATGTIPDGTASSPGRAGSPAREASAAAGSSSPHGAGSSRPDRPRWTKPTAC